MTTITEATSDIFTAPSLSVLCHACNCRGSWGAGVAAAFKSRCPSAYELYHSHCTSPLESRTLHEHQESLLGTCLLIPPSERSPSPTKDTSSRSKGKSKAKSEHYIACLFTSVGYGRNTAPAAAILENTRKAVEDLRVQLETLKKEEEGEGREVGGVWSVRINSGLFSVPWEETLEVLKEGGVEMKIVRPAGEAEREEKAKGKRGGRGVGKGRGGVKRVIDEGGALEGRKKTRSMRSTVDQASE